MNLLLMQNVKERKRKKQRQIFEWIKIANKESKIEIECSWRTILNMRSAGAGRINCLHYWNALSFALFEHVNWIGYCRLVGYCCCWYYCRYHCCCFFFFVGGVANGVIKWNLQFLSVYRFYLCGYQKYYKCRNHTVVFDLEFIWSVGSIFPNWFFVGYRRSTARTNNIEMKNRRTKLQTINSDENMRIEWNQQTAWGWSIDVCVYFCVYIMQVHFFD